MPKYVALLRGINVTGSGILAMKDLAAICEALGFAQVRTYIQSGNVVFGSRLGEASVKARLEKALEAHMGKKIAVMVRTGEELRAVLQANPFPGREGAKTAVVFLNGAAPADPMEGVKGLAGEEIQAGQREVYIWYPNGQGQSKLKLTPGGELGTVRNMNTVAKLVELMG